MPISRSSILRNIRAYSVVQLEHMQDEICSAVITGRAGLTWQEVSNAIDAEIDRRMGYLPPFWALTASC